MSSEEKSDDIASSAVMPDSEWIDAEKKVKEIEEELSPGQSSFEMPPSTSNGASSSTDPLPAYAFCLPNLEGLPADFRVFLEKDLFEMTTQRRLENSRHLNWWDTIGARLFPLSTTGDGNCLLHAASLGMWGLHDRQLLLRNALYEILLRGSRRNALWRRWKWAESKANEAIGVRLSDEEWATEWRNVVNLASPTPRKQDESSSSSSDQIYEGLETIHVFALSHVLKRPIVVVSDTVLRNANGEELSPIGFGGVYLPLECDPNECHRSPLVLCYDSAHFSPLVCMKDHSTLQQIIPITDVWRKLLPLHFAVDPGPDFTWWMDEEDERMAASLQADDECTLRYMNEYMDLVRIDIRRGSARKTRRIRREGSGKCMTLACSGMSGGGSEKKRILNEITQQVRRTLRLTNNKHKEPMDVRTCVDALSRPSVVVAAMLNGTSHEYMDQLASQYIKGAKERFSTSTKETVSSGRSRLGRSFSASTLLLTCINTNCIEMASQATNFYCISCLERQKALLTSFSSDGTRRMRRIMMQNDRSTEERRTAKSSTMPTLSARTVTQSDDTHPVLIAVSSDGLESLPLEAVSDEDGVTHYYAVDAENSSICPVPSLSLSPAHSVRMQTAH